MIEGFESFSIKSWSESGFLTRRAHRKEPKRLEERNAMGQWDLRVSKTLSGSLIMSALLTLNMPGAIAAPSVTKPQHEYHVSQTAPSASIGSIREINRSFNELFDSVRVGATLIPSEDIRLLAKRAVLSQKEPIDIDSWARNLANDIKVADD